MNQAWRRPSAICLAYALLSLVFCWPLFARPFGVGLLDWDQHLFYYAEALKNVVEYGQLPLWSPWYCGGNVLWQNPRVALLSPVYPLAIVVPLALAMKVNIVLHYWIGFVGMHLLLARVTLRAPELAIRSALGASRWQIVRLLLAESAVLAVIGGVAGFLLARWGIDLLVSVAPRDIPRLDEIGMDGRVLGFTLAVTLLASATACIILSWIALMEAFARSVICFNSILAFS